MAKRNQALRAWSRIGVHPGVERTSAKGGRSTTIEVISRSGRRGVTASSRDRCRDSARVLPNITGNPVQRVVKCRLRRWYAPCGGTVPVSQAHASSNASLILALIAPRPFRPSYRIVVSSLGVQSHTERRDRTRRQLNDSRAQADERSRWRRSAQVADFPCAPDRQRVGCVRTQSPRHSRRTATRCVPPIRHRRAPKVAFSKHPTTRE